MRGVIDRLGLGYGFITGEDQVEYFFHARDLAQGGVKRVRFGRCSEGMDVEFERVRGERGWRAAGVRLMEVTR